MKSHVARTFTLSVAAALALLPLGAAAVTPRLHVRPARVADTQAAPVRTAFALYFPAYPISLDNRPATADYYATEYLKPSGENGKFAWCGGLLRDRPVPQAPVGDPDWRLRNLEAEVRTARSSGLDGFTLDMLSTSRKSSDALWTTQAQLMKAAENVGGGFSVTLLPDMSGDTSRMSPEDLAAATAELGRSKAATRLPDGRLVVMPFQPEVHDVAWWQRYLDVSRRQHGIEVALSPVFVAEASTLIPRFAPISYAVSHWGSRNPDYNDPTLTHETAPRQLAALAHSLGLKWIQPVSFQDERPNQGVFDEAANTGNLRATWKLAEVTQADSVHLLTWNDYSEGTQMAPSLFHGTTILDLNRGYLDTYRKGSPAPITKDALYVTHRRQPHYAQPTTGVPMRNRGGTPTRDMVEVVARLTAPGQVTVQAGERSATCALPAGEGICTVPLASGTVTATLRRDGSRPLTLKSPYEITANPQVQDLQYVGATVTAD